MYYLFGRLTTFGNVTYNGELLAGNPDRKHRGKELQKWARTGACKVFASKYEAMEYKASEEIRFQDEESSIDPFKSLEENYEQW